MRGRAFKVVNGTLRHNSIVIEAEQVEKCVYALRSRNTEDITVDELKALFITEGLGEAMDAQPNLWHSIATLLCRTTCKTIYGKAYWEE